eukprot:CAMPEP_0179025836 /NCGR_PEP_ID=MMETSP0796-20121207/8198_1 /TAXON_ID=73915 /ORGANISM="Pyrodinium bahamense, Strain pbaha01" /LENGTH=478 /DNA_ID=CAMNT_0020721885 /DNA_START=288 /DNA_END=1720 /DNA_ORIENTATION=+
MVGWVVLACAFSCITCAALAAGLTLGLTSIDEFKMKILLHEEAEEIEPSAPPSERAVAQQRLLDNQKHARKILPLISGHYFGSTAAGYLHAVDPTNEHYLLVTLLLANATANEALPLFLDKLVPAWLACLLSVSVVLIFGEIIPSAVFTGPKQLLLAARMSPLVRAVKFVLLPLAWPLSLMLDKCLGREEECYSRAHIKGLIRALSSISDTSIIELDEANMIHGVLELHHKTAGDIAQPLSKAKMLAHDAVLDRACLEEVSSWGHSRVFVFRRQACGAPQRWGSDIVGALLVKKLVTVDPDDKCRVDGAGWALKEPVVLGPGENLLSTLNKFQAGQCHLAVVGDEPEALQAALRSGRPIPEGIRPTMFCTLEDVIEELMKEEIYDEEDVELGRDVKPPREVFLRLSKDLTPRISRMRLGLSPKGKLRGVGSLQELRRVPLTESPWRGSNDASAPDFRSLSGSLSAPLLPRHSHSSSCG